MSAFVRVTPFWCTTNRIVRVGWTCFPNSLLCFISFHKISNIPVSSDLTKECLSGFKFLGLQSIRFKELVNVQVGNSLNAASNSSDLKTRLVSLSAEGIELLLFAWGELAPPYRQPTKLKHFLGSVNHNQWLYASFQSSGKFNDTSLKWIGPLLVWMEGAEGRTLYNWIRSTWAHVNVNLLLKKYNLIYNFLTGSWVVWCQVSQEKHRVFHQQNKITVRTTRLKCGQELPTSLWSCLQIKTHLTGKS